MTIKITLNKFKTTAQGPAKFPVPVENAECNDFQRVNAMRVFCL